LDREWPNAKRQESRTVPARARNAEDSGGHVFHDLAGVKLLRDAARKQEVAFLKKSNKKL